MTTFLSNDVAYPDDFRPPSTEAYSEEEILRLVLLGAAVEQADSPYSASAIAVAAEDSFYQFLQERDEHMREKGGEEEFRIGYETAIEDKEAEERKLDEEVRKSLSTIADLRRKLYDRSTPALTAVKERLRSLENYEDNSASEIEKWAYEDGVKMTVRQALELIRAHEDRIQDEINFAERAAQDDENRERAGNDA